MTFKLEGARVTAADIVVGFVILAVVVVILYPVLDRAREPLYKPSCQSNLKMLGTVIAAYCGDYNDMLPSSVLCGGSETWSARNFTRFAKERGVLPLPANPTARTWTMLLYPYTKNRDIIWCPSDPNQDDSANGTTKPVSYYWKAAVDRAWYGDSKIKARKEADFDFPADQIILYEHNSWHWGNESRGLTDGVTINCLYIDGHVAGRTIRNSGYTDAENPPDPLPKSGVGEPAWFNCNLKAISTSSSRKPITLTGRYWDPHIWGDRLP